MRLTRVKSRLTWVFHDPWLGIPLPFNRVVLFLITLLQITIICLGNYITPNQTMPHGELNTQRLLKGHTVKSSPPHIYILIYNGHQISLV